MATAMRYDMTKGNPIKLILKFSMPMLIGNIFQQTYSMADSAILGKYVGDKALAAVGSTGSITFLFFSLVFGLSSGIGIVVSQYYGARDEQSIKKSISTAIYIMMGSSLLMGVITVVAARLVLQLLGTPKEVIDDATLYLQVVGIGVIAVGAANGMSAILRALGDSITPFIFLLVGCISNILLDLLFVIEFNGGVLGVAVATVISQFIAAIGSIICGWYMKPIFKMRFKDLVIEPEIFKKCIVIGTPIALQSSLIAISCVVLQGVVNSYGEKIMAAYTIAGRIEQLIQQPFNSIGMAVGTYTGQNMGANNTERVKKGFWAGTIICTAFSLMMLPVILLGGEQIMKIFTDDPEVIFEGARGIRINCFFYSALGMIYVTRSILNGCGDVKFTMYSGMIEVLSRVCLAKPLTYIPTVGMLSIWYTSALTWTITGIISCIRYAGGKWKKIRIVEKQEIKDAIDMSR